MLREKAKENENQKYIFSEKNNTRIYITERQRQVCQDVKSKGKEKYKIKSISFLRNKNDIKSM